MGDVVVSALAGQQLPDGYYHLDRTITRLVRHGGEIGCCGTCLGARGIGEDRLVNAATRSTMEQLADRTAWADKVITF